MASSWGFVGLPTSGGVRAPYYRNILPPVPSSTPFNPATDINDCVLWLDANDASILQINQDSNGNQNRVIKWFDKAKPSNQNYFTHIGSQSNSGLYNAHKMNGFNTVYFEPYAAMGHQDGGLTFNFQARTLFITLKQLTDMSGAVNTVTLFSGQDTGGMTAEVFYDGSNALYKLGMYEAGTFSNLIAFDLSNNPLNNRQILMFAQTDQVDLSGNAATFDTAYQPLVSDTQATSYNTNQIQYVINSETQGGTFDLAEIIMYGRLLTTDEQNKVNDYLSDKWNLSGASGSGVNGPSIYATSTNTKDPDPEEEKPGVFTYTYIIYGVFVEGEFPNFYWCDENAQVESPPVLAEGYDGTTALRDGLAVVVSGVFYQ